MWVKYISIYTNIISFQRLFPILLILNILCKHTQHASFFSQTRLPILFSSSPLHGLIVDETRNCMTVKKKRRERERKKRGENSSGVLYLSRVLCYPQFMRTRIPPIFIAHAYYSPFFHPLLFLYIDIDLSCRLCFCRGDCRRDMYSLEYQRRM